MGEDLIVLVNSLASTAFHLWHLGLYTTAQVTSEMSLKEFEVLWSGVANHTVQKQASYHSTESLQAFYYPQIADNVPPLILYCSDNNASFRSLQWRSMVSD